MDAHGMGAYDRPPRVTACAADGTARREVEASGWPDRKSQVRNRLPLTARFQYFIMMELQLYQPLQPPEP
jgi:hypothetical protein